MTAAAFFVAFHLAIIGAIFARERGHTGAGWIGAASIFAGVAFVAAVPLLVP